MDPVEQFVIPILRSRYLIVLTLLLGVVGGVFAALTVPNTYVSTGKILVQLGEREASTPDMSVEASGGGSRGFTLQTEISILSGQQLLEEVAKIVGPAEVLRPYDPRIQDTATTPSITRRMHQFQYLWFKKFGGGTLPGHPENCACEACLDEATRMLFSHIVIEEESRANTVSISYGANNPLLARRVVSVFLDVANQRHIRLFSTDKKVEQLSHDFTEVNAAASKAEQDFDGFCRRNDVFDLPAQKSGLIQTIATLEKQVAADRGKIQGLEAQIAALSAKLEKEPRTDKQLVESPPVANPDRAAVQNGIIDLQKKRTELAEQWPPESDMFKAKDKLYSKQLDDLKAELERLPMLVAVQPIMRDGPNPRYQELVSQLDLVTKEKTTLEKPTDEADRQLQVSREQLRKLQELTHEYETLQSTARGLRTDANAIEDAYKRARRLHELDKAQLSNLLVSTPPDIPLDKSEPKRGKIVGIGIALGLFGGIGLAMLRHMLDRRIRRPHDIQRFLGVRVIGVVPEIKRWRGAKGLMRRNGRM